MIERRMIYRLSLDMSTPVRLTEERQEELAAAVLEALRVLGVSFWMEDDSNQLMKIDYVKTEEMIRRMQ